MKKVLYIAILSVLAVACKPKLEGEVELSAGELNLSNVVYTGDHLLSGYTDGGLYREGQTNSIPAILSTQFAMVGGGSVSQPLMPSGSGTGHLIMDSYNTNGTFTTAFESSSSAKSGERSVINPYCLADSIMDTYQTYSGGITNFSFPYLRVNELSLSGLGNTSSSWFNPFYARITPGDNSFIATVEAQSPTFFICGFGLSDVLSRVEAGWSCGYVTDETNFKDNYRELLNSLTSKTSDGLLLEVPAMDNLPYLNANYVSEQTIYIEAKRNYNNEYEIRTYEGDDQFFRSAIDKIGVDGYGLSDTLPIRNEDIIDRWEKFQIASDIDKYNQAINELAAEFDLPVVSMEKYLISETDFQGDSLLFNGTNLQVNYKEGSAVSLDGYSPSGRGAAGIANKCIRAINEFYGANIPLADINNYPGLKIP